jgi:hypothetical protein
MATLDRGTLDRIDALIIEILNGPGKRPTQASKLAQKVRSRLGDEKRIMRTDSKLLFETIDGLAESSFRQRAFVHPVPHADEPLPASPGLLFVQSMYITHPADLFCSLSHQIQDSLFRMGELVMEYECF